MIRSHLGRAGAVLAAAFAAVMLAVPAVGASSAAPARAPLTVTYFTNGGNNNSPNAAGNGGAGNQIVQSVAPGIHLTFSNSTTYQGDPAGTMKLPNGNFMAANAGCNGVTIKSSSSSDGTVWADHVNANGFHQLVNRFCSTPSGDRVVMYADNVINHQWHFCDTGPINVDCGADQFWNLQRNVL